MGFSEFYEERAGTGDSDEIYRCYVEVGKISDDAESLALLKERLEAAGKELKYLKRHAVEELRSLKKWCQYEPDLLSRLAEAEKSRMRSRIKSLQGCSG